MNDVLIHHGIKGQRWGVRRYQNEDGSLTSAGRQRQEKENSESKGKSIAKKVGIATSIGASGFVMGYAMHKVRRNSNSYSKGKEFIARLMVLPKYAQMRRDLRAGSYSKGKEFIARLMVLPKYAQMRRDLRTW